MHIAIWATFSSKRDVMRRFPAMGCRLDVFTAGTTRTRKKRQQLRRNRTTLSDYAPLRLYDWFAKTPYLSKERDFMGSRVLRRRYGA